MIYFLLFPDNDIFWYQFLMLVPNFSSPYCNSLIQVVIIPQLPVFADADFLCNPFSCLIFFLIIPQTKSSSSFSLVGCSWIRLAVIRRPFPSCLFVAEKETFYVAMTVRWSSLNCFRTKRNPRGRCCRTVAGPTSCLFPSTQRKSTCIRSADEFITPARSAVGALAWSDPLWRSSSAPFSSTLRTANQDSRLTSSGGDTNTNWPIALQDTSPLRWQRALVGTKENWNSDPNWPIGFYITIPDL